MNWILLWFALEAGYLPQGDMVMYEPPDYATVAGMFYTGFEARATLGKVLFLGGSAKTFVFDKKGTYMFSPERMLYGFEAGINLGPQVEVGFRHFCTHPVMPYLQVGLHGNPVRPPLWEGSYEELYIRIEGGSR